MSLQPSSEPKADPIGKPIGIRFLSVFLLNSLALFLNSPVFGCDQGRPHPPAPSRTPLHYPTKPLEFVVPTAGGSATDVMARLIASIVSKENLVCRCKDKKEVCEPLSTNVMNRPGAVGGVAFDYLLKKKGDINTLSILPSSFLVIPPTGREPFAWRSLTAIGQLAVNDFFLWVRSDAPYSVVKDCVHAAEKQPDKIALGIADQAAQIPLILLQQAARVSLKHIVLRTIAEAVVALEDRQVESILSRPSPVIQLYKAGRIKPLAVFNAERSALFPNVETLKEAGYNINYRESYGIFAPPQVGKDTADYYILLLKKFSDTEQWREYLTKQFLRMEFVVGSQYEKQLTEYVELQKVLLKARVK